MGVFVFYCVYMCVCIRLCCPVPKQITEVLGWGGYAVVKGASLAKVLVAGDRLLKQPEKAYL